jgi:hypothetical protein
MCSASFGPAGSSFVFTTMPSLSRTITAFGVVLSTQNGHWACASCFDRGYRAVGGISARQFYEPRYLT